MYVVIENVAGYMPEDDDPFTTEDYSEAVRVLNEMADQWAAEPDVVEVQRDWASGDNLAAYRVLRTGHLLDVVGEIVIGEED